MSVLTGLLKLKKYKKIVRKLPETSLRIGDMLLLLKGAFTVIASPDGA